MHQRNIHRAGYDFDALVNALPELAVFVNMGASGRRTINFADASAVKALNKALLKHHYAIPNWDIPAGYLCPPVPGRADYIHAIADLLNESALTTANSSQAIRGLDIGTGANLIYPILGSQIYNWKFVATDIDKIALNSASLLVNSNNSIKGKITLRSQSNKKLCFKGVLGAQDSFAFSMCNPPFHASAAAASEGTLKKTQNLVRHRRKRTKAPNVHKFPSALQTKNTLNFAGQAGELWCEGGELAFIKTMIAESIEFKEQIIWFTSLVSNKKHLLPIKQSMQQNQVKEHKVVEMAQGSKISRFIAWRF